MSKAKSFPALSLTKAMAEFTPSQGRYLAFINAYINSHGYPPSESEMSAAMCVSGPSVNQMVKMLEKRGLILRQPGQTRAIQILIPEEEIPRWGNSKRAAGQRRPASGPPRREVTPAAPPAKLYVFRVVLVRGPVGEKFSNTLIKRVIEIRGDQTLEEFHLAILQAYDRRDDHSFQFQFGKRPFDPDGPNYGMSGPQPGKKVHGDARIKLDDLKLISERAFGYWFDFAENWYHQVQVERMEKAIPTVTYPRLISRVGKSPPQYGDKGASGE